MKLTKSLGVKLLQLCNGERIPASKLNYPLVKELLAEGIILDNRSGRSKSVLYIQLPEALNAFLFNRYSISDLKNYIESIDSTDLTRAVLVQYASDSKVKKVRTFKGFIVNSYQPIPAKLDKTIIVIDPPLGTFQFIHNYEHFIPDPQVTIIGIENSENFSQISKQQYLFNGLQPLFVSRYPQGQNRDLIKWLQKIPNSYIHFGDFDFAGISIYLNEYKKHLGNRATFLIPQGIETLLAKCGSKRLYDVQKATFKVDQIEEEGLLKIIQLLHKYKKGLEQEALIPLP
jgi:hypothetical protein